MTDFLKNLPKNLFFTGKGGVGKTTTSAATAIALADSGKQVLLVSTDPASNLDEVLGLSLSDEPTQVTDVPGLFASNVDPVERRLRNFPIFGETMHHTACLFRNTQSISSCLFTF